MAPGRKRKPTKTRQKSRVVVTYRDIEDPSCEELALARQAIDSVQSASVVSEIPGAIQVDVSKRDASKLRDRIETLKSWELAEEGIAQMPDAQQSPSPDRKAGVPKPNRSK